MNKALLVCVAFVLSACSAVPPKPDKHSSMVYLSVYNREVLLAQKVDGKTVDDGRYFRLEPGRHKLEVLAISDQDEGTMLSRFATIEFDNFLPEGIYYLSLVTNSTSINLQLLDGNRTLIKEAAI